MKKVLALVLALAMVLVFAACGSTETADTTETAATESAAPAAESSTEATADSAEEAVTFEPMTIKVSLQAQQTEVAGAMFSEFAEYVTEQTGGAVTFNVNYGGTIASAMEELELCGSGAVDMIILSQPMYSEALPLINFPSQIKGDAETIIDFANYMLFDNEATATLIQEEAASYNVKYLNARYTGSTAFVCTKPFSSLADLEGLKVGNMDTTKFVSAGLTAITCMPNETYESLQRGVIDASEISMDGIYSMGWYEVAPYINYDGLSAIGGPYTINIDTWNSMSPELQAIIQEGADQAAEKEATQAMEKEAEWQADMESKGATFGSLPEEDQLTFVRAAVDGNFAAQMAVCEKQGIADKEQVIQDAIVAYFDYLQ